MYLVLDENNNILTCITVGDRPDTGIVREVDYIPTDVMTRIFDYQFIDGQFVLKDSAVTDELEQVKRIKVEWLRNTCSMLINDGIDFNGEHYSLSEHDQINLSNLSTTAMIAPQTPLFYHADGKLCRQYTPEEILQLSQIGIAWISWHTTYNNFAKAYINTLTTEEEVKLFRYGMQFSPDFQSQFDDIVRNFPITFDQQIEDDTDYERRLHPWNNPQFALL